MEPNFVTAAAATCDIGLRVTGGQDFNLYFGPRVSFERYSRRQLCSQVTYANEPLMQLSRPRCKAGRITLQK